METRTARCRILPDGRVVVTTSSQSPYAVKELLSGYFGIPEGNVTVKTPFLGGGFGGKTTVQLEVLAYMASRAAGGQCVSLTNTREEDFAVSPCHLGLQGKIKIGAAKDGKITAAQMEFYVDSGAYADISPKLAKSIAAECAGVYHIPNLICDCYSVYTNHCYPTSFRGFGHEEYTFCLERTIEKLGQKLGLDSFAVRLLNVAREGDTKPTQVKVTADNSGDIGECLGRLQTMMNWDEGPLVKVDENLVRAKGISAFIKTSDTPTDAAAAVLLNFNSDGSVNLNSGAVEMGPGVKTTAVQILAEKMRMPPEFVHTNLDVDTGANPILWKTVASMTTLMMGRAVLNAADDALRQLFELGAAALRCPPEDLDYGDRKIFLKNDPTVFIEFKDLVHGYKYPDGNAVKGPVIGRGSFIMTRLTPLSEATGEGRAGQSWTPGAQGVEIEYDAKKHTYRVLKAAAVLDAGKVINPKTARGLVMGGMCMGLGLAMSEEFVYDPGGIPQTTSFRTYKMLHSGEAPDYIVDFVETPQSDAPYGARGLGEHGIIGIPAALGNAISLAAGIEADTLPVTPELIWREAAKK
jgi:CO/xanthine dehydrogenase Mo-binding subunit